MKKEEKILEKMNELNLKEICSLFNSDYLYTLSEEKKLNEAIDNYFKS